MTCVYSVDLLNKHFVHRVIAKKHSGQKSQILSRNYDTGLHSTTQHESGNQIPLWPEFPNFS